ncbi:MAG: RusA family crossover junction endodeoxyribonuclease [Clostridia bacterium]|nr:RusA family crossover junction endodeoxyribonuclease [Clostridia bacterium]
MRVEFTAYGKPQGKARPRFTRQGNRAYTPKETKLYEQQIAKAYRAAANGFSFGDKPVEIWITAVFAKAKTSKKEYPTLKPDIDNIQKAVFDGLNGIAYNDDKQILATTVHKCFCMLDNEQPRILVTVKEYKGNE